jgi:alpha-N-arabinofuranosidase
MHASKYGRGLSLETKVESPCYRTTSGREVPCLETAAVWNEEKGELTVFAVNKSDKPMELETVLEGFGALTLKEHITMQGHDLKAENTADHPDNVLPQQDGVTAVEGGKAVSTLHPYSWNVIRFSR